MVNFLFFMVLHLIGDFYLQTTKVARCKNAKVSPVCNQCAKCKKGAKLN